jgi:hypothetical protein
MDMDKIRFAASLALALGFTGCLDAEEHVSDTDQAVTVFDSCATGSGVANAMEESINVGDTWLRSGVKINSTCDCLNWEIEKHNTDEATANVLHPKCRPMTIVEYGLGAGVRRLKAETNGTWEITNPTECVQSTLNVWVQQFDASVHDYVTITGGFSGDVHPTWTGTNCVQSSFFKDVLIGVGGSQDFRIKARATRGADTTNNGYEGVVISVQPQ